MRPSPSVDPVIKTRAMFDSFMGVFDRTTRAVSLSARWIRCNDQREVGSRRRTKALCPA
jgi:hypothetical protein